MQVNLSDLKLTNRFSVLHPSKLPNESKINSEEKRIEWQNLQEEISDSDLAKVAAEKLGVELDDFIRYAVVTTATDLLAKHYQQFDGSTSRSVLEQFEKVDAQYKIKKEDVDKGIIKPSKGYIPLGELSKGSGIHVNYVVNWALLKNYVLYVLHQKFGHIPKGTANTVKEVEQVKQELEKPKTEAKPKRSRSKKEEKVSA